ncbi:YraN family protein [uncultured Tessaracoccus sp.]|uniref:YraN family protein n=1 Tax=uncultured Tessaracoccus sp. TaxID=905023 RepID=UPI002601217F|nr:YraN family protein [uncultured Tessaracoccus sp.]
MVRLGKVSRALGRHGEDVAARYLQGLGLEILSRNWSCPHGELDIVAYDDARDALVFVEVKTRSGRGFGHPLEAITHDKARRLYQLARLWLDATGRRARTIRVDAVGVLLAGQAPEITHVEGVAA